MIRNSTEIVPVNSGKKENDSEQFRKIENNSVTGKNIDERDVVVHKELEIPDLAAFLETLTNAKHPEHLKNLAQIQNARSLNLSGIGNPKANNYHIRERDLQSLLSYCPNLVELDLSGCGIGHYHLTHIAKLGSLEKLFLLWSSGITGNDLEYLEPLKNLKYLNRTFGGFIPKEAIFKCKQQHPGIEIYPEDL